MIMNCLSTCGITLLMLFTTTVISAENNLTLHPKLKKLELSGPGRILLLRDGRFCCVSKGKYLVSSDAGKSWKSEGTITSGPGPKVQGGMLVENEKGVLVLIYRDDAGIKLERTPENMPLPGAKLQIWSVRSTDGGKTWGEHQRLIEGFCGAMIDVLALSDNKIILPLQELRYNPPRHVTIVFVSEDGGQSWNKSDALDIGGYGIEDGAFEPTVAQRKDGSLLLFLRTSRDRLWQSESQDLGKTWKLPVPTDIKASNSPPFLLSLKSKRLAMVWNPLFPEGKKEWPRRVKPRYAERPDNVFREEICFAISDDDGQTWTKPVVIAKQPGSKLRYAYMFERRPGEIWLALRGQWFQIHERDFVIQK